MCPCSSHHIIVVTSVTTELSPEKSWYLKLGDIELSNPRRIREKTVIFRPGICMFRERMRKLLNLENKRNL